MRITAELPLMAELTQEVMHSGIVLHIPRRQVQWQPLGSEAPRASGSSRALAPGRIETQWDRLLSPSAANR